VGGEPGAGGVAEARDDVEDPVGDAGEPGELSVTA